MSTIGKRVWEILVGALGIVGAAGWTGANGEAIAVMGWGERDAS